MDIQTKQKLNKKWAEISNKGYMLYSICELAEFIANEMFDKSCFEELPTYVGTKQKQDQSGEDITIYYDLMNNNVFECTIDCKYGVDYPMLLKEAKYGNITIPVEAKDIWEIYSEEYENDEENEE